MPSFIDANSLKPYTDRGFQGGPENDFDIEPHIDSRVLMTDEYQEYIDNLPVDYRGEKIYGSYDGYNACIVCQKGIFRLYHISGMCPLCVVAAPLFWLEIAFGKSPSPNYKDAVSLARGLLICSGNTENHMLIIDSLDDYIKYRIEINKLIDIASGWKSFKATVNGESLNARQLSCIVEEINYMVRDGT